MEKHALETVSYKAARALAYLMTRKWWKELKEIYYSLSDNIYAEEGLSIEDWILENADEYLVIDIIPWAATETPIKVWRNRHEKFRKLWNNNFER